MEVNHINIYFRYFFFQREVASSVNINYFLALYSDQKKYFGKNADASKYK